FNVKDFTRPIPEFTGDFNGNGETLDELPCCLIETLKNNGTVRNINFNHVDTRSATCDPAVAKVMDLKSIVSCIKIENSQFEGNGSSINLGMVTNLMNRDSRLENVMIVSSNIISTDQVICVGGAVGHQNGASIDNIMIVSSNIISKDQIEYMGGVVGRQNGASIDNIMIVSSNITGEKESFLADIGGVVGLIKDRSEVKKVYVVSVIVTQFGQENNVGGIAGYSSNTDIQSVTVMDSIVHGSGKMIGGVVGWSNSDLLKDVNVTRTTVSGFGSGDVYIGGVCGSASDSDIQKATVSSAIIIAPQYSNSVCLGGGAGIVGGGTIEDLTVIDTVITADSRKLIYVGGSVGSLSGTKGSRVMVINTTINIEENVQKGDVGWMAGNMQASSSFAYFLVSNSLINIKELNDINVGGGAGVMSESSISNFTISNSSVLLEGEGLKVNIGFCIGYNKGGNNKCDFNEAIKSFFTSTYNDEQGVLCHKYKYDMAVTTDSVTMLTTDSVTMLTTDSVTMLTTDSVSSKAGKDYVPATAVIVGALGASSSLSYLGYHLVKKYKEGHRGRELLQEGLRSACCNCCGHLEDNDDNDDNGVGSVENGSEQKNSGCSGNREYLTIPNAIEMEPLIGDSDC
ncbi:MAG: hypothetical protein QS748_14345, partial [Candidatus Endonucleobacter bathymodioli]|nr:hypothetical protein [Candidatus Endonucleobacter bathymodioli]